MAGVVLLALYGAGLVTAAELVGVPTTLFLAVYLCCTLSAARTLRGAARGCSVAAFIAVAVLLAFCGWALAFAAAVAFAAALYSDRRPRRARHDDQTSACLLRHYHDSKDKHFD